MKNYLYGILATALLAFTACTKEELSAPEPAPAPDVPAEYRSGEVLVKFAPYVSDILDREGITRSGGPATRSGILSVDEILDIVGGYEIERVFPVDPRNEERTRESELHLWYVVRFGEEYTAAEVAERFSALGEVQHVSVNRTIHRAYNAGKKAAPLSRKTLEAIQQQRATRTGEASAYPFDDVLLPQQWHLVNRGNMFGGKSIVDADVQCEQAWKLSTGDESIVVAVLDEGVMIEHPDLKNNMWVNENEIYRSHKDNDGNGYQGDVYGYNFVKNTGVISWDDVSDTGHGTHVAGVIAAQNDNGIGISSIAGGRGSIPGVKIMSCQIFSGDAAGNALSTVKAIKYAADNGAVVLQCSWGYVSGLANSYEWGDQGFKTQEEWEQACPLEKEALEYFIHNAGSPNGPIEGGLAIFAGGNENAPMAGFPGAADYCISVSATAADYTPAVYSNYGPGITIAAPGGEGAVTVTYRPKGHPGVFDRRIFVYTQLSDKEPTAILSLRGAVTASVRTDDDYPHAMGALRLKQRTVRFGRTDKVQSERIECLNAGDKPLTPACDEGFAATGLSFACEPATLAPGAKGDLVVRFDPAKAPQPLRRTPLPVGGPDVPPSQRMLWIEFGETE